jgi:hypothetical protein
MIFPHFSPRFIHSLMLPKIRLVPLIGSALALAAVLPNRAAAWSAPTHRAIEQLALDSLPADFPAFTGAAAAKPQGPEAAKAQANRARILFLAAEPDSWRSSRDSAFRHITDKEHEIDLEQLPAAGIDPATVTSFYSDFLVQFAAGKAAHADRFPGPGKSKDYNHLFEWPGSLPWAVAADFGQLQEFFSEWKTYRQYGTPAEVADLEDLIVAQMGLMGHYVGDSSQPLHDTVHHHGWDCFGWKAPNPNGYSTRSNIHDWIDGSPGMGGGFIGRAKITAESLSPQMTPAKELDVAVRPDGRDPVFVAIMDFVIAQNKEVEPLYQLDKDGKLKADGSPGSLDGKPFIEDQILKGARMLGAIWLTAWRQAAPDTYLQSSLVQRPPAKQ